MMSVSAMRSHFSVTGTRTAMLSPMMLVYRDGTSELNNTEASVLSDDGVAVDQLLKYACCPCSL